MQDEVKWKRVRVKTGEVEGVETKKEERKRVREEEAAPLCPFYEPRVKSMARTG